MVSQQAAESESDKKEGAGAATGSQAVKLSTGVQLPKAGDGSSSISKKKKKAKKSKADGSKDGIAAAKPKAKPSPALAPYHAIIQDYMASVGFTEATPIQERCWPDGCAGNDVQGVAEPGSGKTLAYLLPAFARLQVWCSPCSLHAVRVCVVLPACMLCVWCMHEPAALPLVIGSALRMWA